MYQDGSGWAYVRGLGGRFKGREFTIVGSELYNYKPTGVRVMREGCASCAQNNPAETTQVIQGRDRYFLAKVVWVGDRYGRNKVLTHTGKGDSFNEPMIEVYDMTYAGKPGFDPEGQFVSRYYSSTLMKGRGGINMHGGVPEWTIGDAAGEKLRKFARDAYGTYTQRDPRGVRNNPIDQTLKVTIHGKKYPVRIVERERDWVAGGVAKRQQVIVSGKSKQDVLEKFLAQMSNVLQGASPFDTEARIKQGPPGLGPYPVVYTKPE